jgi:hypothetical protein
VIAWPDNLDMAQLSFYRGFAHGPENPFYEAAYQYKRNDAEGNCSQGYGAATPLPQDVAKCQR